MDMGGLTVILKLLADNWVSLHQVFTVLFKYFNDSMDLMYVFRCFVYQNRSNISSHTTCLNDISGLLRL